MLTVFRLRTRQPECEAKQWGLNLNRNFTIIVRRLGYLFFQHLDQCWKRRLWILMFALSSSQQHCILLLIARANREVVRQMQTLNPLNVSSASDSHGHRNSTSWMSLLLIWSHSIVYPSSTCHLTHTDIQIKSSAFLVKLNFQQLSNISWWRNERQVRYDIVYLCCHPGVNFHQLWPRLSSNVCPAPPIRVSVTNQGGRISGATSLELGSQGRRRRGHKPDHTREPPWSRVCNRFYINLSTSSHLTHHICPHLRQLDQLFCPQLNLGFNKQ